MKAIVFYLPEWMMNAPILKRVSATNGCSVVVDEIEVTQSMLDAMLNPCPVFYKDGTEVKCFWPHQYACIETFGKQVKFISRTEEAYFCTETGHFCNPFGKGFFIC